MGYFVVAPKSRSRKVLARKFNNSPPKIAGLKWYEPQRLLEECRAKGLPEEETRKIILDFCRSEVQKCMDDLIYFADNYVLIAGHGASGIIQFKCEKYQKELLIGLRNDKYTVVNKARQLGVSTALMIFSLWFSIFSPGKRTLVVAHTKQSADEFVGKLKLAYEMLPDWVKPACIVYSKSTVEFETKSVIRAITSNANAARSFSATLFIMDEAAFIKDCGEVVKAIMPTITAADGKLVALSTPNGNSDENWFYTTCTGAKAGTNGWRLCEFPWTVSSLFTKNKNFKQDQIRLDNGREDKFKQEYELCFDVNLSSIFTDGVLREFNTTARILNKVSGGLTYEDTLHIWKMSEARKSYIIGVDCASNKATARDKSAFQVIDAETQEQVCEYEGKLPTEVFVDILVRTAKHYNNALLVVEENAYSTTPFYLLQTTYNYSNLWYSPGKSEPGFNTNRGTRMLLLDKLLIFYNNYRGVKLLHSSRLKSQIENFSAHSIYQDGSRKYEATGGHSDDVLIALCLALIPLDPPSREQNPHSSSVIIDTKDMNATELSEDYLEYYSELMGISATALEQKIKIYYAIKNGDYDGTGLEDLDVKHPVEEWQRQESARVFLGNSVATDDMDAFKVSLNSNSTPHHLNLTDIFSDEYRAAQQAHARFLYG